jgi:hypothetical protein
MLLDWLTSGGIPKMPVTRCGPERCARRSDRRLANVAQLRLDGPISYVELDAADEKNREGNCVVIRPDLAEDLRAWLADKLSSLHADAFRRAEPMPSRLPGDTPVFSIPDGLVRIFDRDLKLAGIPKRDDRGRTLDVHALRTTFGTLLSKGGVPLRTAQAAMRHSDPSLTANVYTDPRLLDVSGALDALPSLPIETGRDIIQERARAAATGTYGRSSVALPVAQTIDISRQSGCIAGQTAIETRDRTVVTGFAPSGRIGNVSGGMTIAGAVADDQAGRTLTGSPAANRLRSAVSDPAVGYRSAGSFARHFRVTRTTPSVG